MKVDARFRQLRSLCFRSILSAVIFVSATLLVLYVLPVLYVMLQDVRKKRVR